MGVRIRQVGTCKSGAVFCANAGASNAVQGPGEAWDPQPEVPAPRFPSVEEFPLEQSPDCSRGTRIQPNAVLTCSHFVVVRHWLYRVGRDTQSEEIVTQLLVPRSCREMVFQVAGHLGYDKTLNRIMARFYWPGIRAEVRLLSRVYLTLGIQS